MNYPETVHFLFQRQQKEIKLGLETIERFLGRLGNPEHRFPSVHIAGTNGKGSTAAMLESVLRHAGYKTGLYTSPHLVDMRERIQVNGNPISEGEVVVYTQRMLPLIETIGPSFFEILTAMAFLYFADQEIDIAVLETGLGGRLDATNVVHPVLALLTEIGLEHTKILGKTLASIAGEKAGIFKAGIPAITGTGRTKVRSILSGIASGKHVPLSFSKDRIRISGMRITRQGSWLHAETESGTCRDLYLKLLGRHQIENARLTLAAVDELKRQGWILPEPAVRLGLENVVWRARLELLRTNPDVLIDSAHNPLGIKTLTRAIQSLFRYDRMILVFGVLDDKNYRSMLEQVAPLANDIILTRPKSERALDPRRMESLVCLRGKNVQTIPDIEYAWNSARNTAGPNDLICGTGSIYFVGEILRLSS